MTLIDVTAATPHLQNLANYQNTTPIETVFSKETQRYLQDHADTIRTTKSQLQKAISGRWWAANSAYIAHFLPLIPAYLFNCINTETFQSLGNVLLPSRFQSLIPAADGVKVAAAMTACCAYIVMAGYNRNLVAQKYLKVEQELRTEILRTRHASVSYLKSIYDPEADKLTKIYNTEAMQDPLVHAEIYQTISTIEKKLPYLQKALIAQKFSLAECLDIMHKTRHIVRTILHIPVGLQYTVRSHNAYNAKYLAEFPISKDNCLPIRAQRQLSQSKQLNRPTGVIQKIVKGILGTAAIAIPSNLFIQHQANSSLSLRSFIDLPFCLSKNAAESCSEAPTTLAISLVSVLVYLAGSALIGTVGSKFKETPAIDPKQRAIKNTMNVYNGVIAYLKGVAQKPDEEKGSEKPRLSNRSAREAPAPNVNVRDLATKIQGKLKAIRHSLTNSGLDGLPVKTIMNDLEGALNAVLQQT